MNDIDTNKAQALKQREQANSALQQQANNADSNSNTLSKEDTSGQTKTTPTPALHHYNPRYGRPDDPLAIFRDISPIGKGNDQSLILIITLTLILTLTFTLP